MQSKPLSGKTIVLTGTQKIASVVRQIETFGGLAVTFPLIQTNEIIDSGDREQLEQINDFDWLIFTSQNAVDAFYNKLKRHATKGKRIKAKIAVVGAKTAEKLSSYNFSVSFTPSIFSADVFAKEFPLISGQNPKCLFIRGSMAKDTLKNGLPFSIKEWTVYQTEKNLSHIHSLIELIQCNQETIILFASPSAVDVFAKYAAKAVGWNSVKIASIGHITAAALDRYGAQITYMPREYTMQAVIQEIIKVEEAKQ